MYIKNGNLDRCVHIHYQMRIDISLSPFLDCALFVCLFCLMNEK